MQIHNRFYMQIHNREYICCLFHIEAKQLDFKRCRATHQNRTQLLGLDTEFNYNTILDHINIKVTTMR